VPALDRQGGERPLTASGDLRCAAGPRRDDVQMVDQL
jgi:hypothetical protein